MGAWRREVKKLLDVYDLKRDEEYLGTFTYDELAEYLDCSVASLKSCVCRANKHHKQAIYVYRYELYESER